ncbi:MAG TPA: MFS transporter, partial [Burkholderiales bacterium]|nr:MFS transporter [Burkholderiales bacterium]
MNNSRPRKNLAPGVAPREVVSWAFYDFANSGYTTVVITAVFNAYFVAEVAGGAPWATFAWTAALAASYALIVVTAPVIGAYADAHAAKKRLLAAATAGCVLFTAGLALVGRGDLALGVALVVLSNFFFGTGENLVAAFLPELARGEALGRISGWGWSLGYFGGLTTLGACLAYVAYAQARGAEAAEFVPVTMLITAGIFALASLPTFLFLRERAVPVAGAGGVLEAALARLAETLRRARRYGDFSRFLVCLVFYQAGIQTVVALAAVYAQEVMGFTTRDTLVLVLLVNVTAAAG